MKKDELDMGKIICNMLDNFLFLIVVKDCLNALWIIDLQKELLIDHEELYLNLKEQGYL